MRIGIMLRHLDQHGGGVLVYTHHLLRELARLPAGPEWVLLCRDPELLPEDLLRERFEIVRVTTPTRLLWDQVGVRRAARRARMDLVFNPKYSLPLRSRVPGVFVCHGLDWYVSPSWSRPVDRVSHRVLVPRYSREAAAIVCVSETTRRHVVEFLGVDEARAVTVYLGVDDAFRTPLAPERLAEVRARHQLPERFFLYVGQIYPPKNFGRLVEAYARVGPRLGIPLVVAGKPTWLAERDLAQIERLGVGEWIRRPGWIGRDEIPAFYQMAEALVMPSLYEACPLPILEAMASGCPVVTANRHGTAELAGKAAELVDPEDVASIAAGMERVATDPDLRARLAAAGRERVAPFTWERCARETVRVLEAVGAAAGARG